MSDSILQKLVLEVHRYQNRDFLKAAIAVCALTAYADQNVSIAERYRIDYAFAHEPSLQVFDKDKVVSTLDDFLYHLKQEGAVAKTVLDNKIRRIAGDHKKSRTLMRVAHLIITADRLVSEIEMNEFTRIGALLDIETDQVLAYLSE